MSDAEKAPKLAEVAARIQAHLNRIEAAQPKSSKSERGHFYHAAAWAAGSRVGVRYVSYQIQTMLRKTDALEYLRWLDAGNVGKHYTVLSFNNRIRQATTDA